MNEAEVPHADTVTLTTSSSLFVRTGVPTA